MVWRIKKSSKKTNKDDNENNDQIDNIYSKI